MVADFVAAVQKGNDTFGSPDSQDEAPGCPLHDQCVRVPAGVRRGVTPDRPVGDLGPWQPMSPAEPMPNGETARRAAH